MKKLAWFRNRIILVLLLIFNFTTTRAQDPDDPDFPFESDPGTPTAPIDQWVYLMIILGLFLGFLIIKKKDYKDGYKTE